MYQYYQTGDENKWHVIPSDDTLSDNLDQLKATKCTILAVSEPLGDDNENLDEIRYKGPFYVDIDCNEDISRAAESVLELVEAIKARGVPEHYIQIFASGGKGFHVILSAKLFSNNRAVKNLPLIYKEMALMLYVYGMDMQVYGVGRGNSWRRENILRENGRYRVRATLSDVERVKEGGRDAYEQLVSKPRLDLKEPSVARNVKSTELETLFKIAKANATKNKIVRDPVSEKKLKEAFKSEEPRCVTEIVKGNASKQANFNQIALSVGTYLARSNASESVIKSYSTLMSEKYDSNTYNTASKRYKHAFGTVNYLRYTPRYSFSCGAMRGILNFDPCEDCPLNDKQNRAFSLDSIGIVEDNNVYYRITKEASTVIGTFNLEPVVKMLSRNPDTPGVLENTGILFNIHTPTGRVYKRTFDEGVWKSKSSLIGALEGIESAVFLGSDQDVQKLKFFVQSKYGEDLDEMVEVDQAGTFVEEINGKSTVTYVEQGVSVNNYGIKNTHKLMSEVENGPAMVDVPITETSVQQSLDAFNLLMGINEKSILARLIGWFVACHYSSHIYSQFGQFPLLNLWGNSGASKTQTSQMMLWLSGCGTSNHDNFLNLPMSTPYPFHQYILSTSGVPRVLEEFNRARLISGKKYYDTVHEALKNAYNRGPVKRGMIGNSRGRGINARTYTAHIRSALLYTSEQPVESPPLVERSVEVGMDYQTKDKYTPVWEELYEVRHHLKTLAKVLMMDSLKTKPETLREVFSTIKVPSGITGARPRFNMQVVAFGLDKMEEILDSVDSRYDAMPKFRKIKKSFHDCMEAFSVEGNLKVTHTETDLIIMDMGAMAYIGRRTQLGTHKGYELVLGRDYVVDGDRLLIDMRMAYHKYSIYKNTMKQQVILGSFIMFLNLLSSETYYKGDSAVSEHFDIPVVELSLTKLKDKNIDTKMFKD